MDSTSTVILGLGERTELIFINFTCLIIDNCCEYCRILSLTYQLTISAHSHSKTRKIHHKNHQITIQIWILNFPSNFSFQFNFFTISTVPRHDGSPRERYRQWNARSRRLGRLISAADEQVVRVSPKVLKFAHWGDVRWILCEGIWKSTFTIVAGELQLEAALVLSPGAKSECSAGRWVALQGESGLEGEDLFDKLW